MKEQLRKAITGGIGTLMILIPMYSIMLELFTIDVIWFLMPLFIGGLCLLIEGIQK